MLSFFNTTIDAIQGAKTQFVKTFAPNDEIAKPLQTYIDAQTYFAKKVASEANSFFTTVGVSAYNFDAKKAFATKTK
jgi:hypothetical protein